VRSFSFLASATLLVLAGCTTNTPQPSGSTPPAPQQAAPAAAKGAPALDIPIDYYKLPNGLRVVLSRDASVPLVTIGVYYNIGFRIEPRNRTGFAHLFEHMMFQGSRNLGKMEFIKLVQANGGVLNGSTRFDFTNYFETVPAHTLETMLWAEADRMRGLSITQENLTNQIEVVKNEVRDNVINEPYGGFPWLDVPQYANTNWHNAHNFYGDLEHLDAATLEDVSAFFKAYYSPDNAALVVAGDFDPARAREWIDKYFSTIERRASPAQPDISEPPQEKQKRASRTDPLAPRPALAVAYHVPKRWSPEYFAFGLIDQILLQGDDSRLNQLLVNERGYTQSVGGGINLLGNMFNYKGPMLWTAALLHDSQHTPDQILADFDSVVTRLQNQPVPQEELDRALTKFRSGLYDEVGQATRFGLVDLLASFALFDDNPQLINSLEQQLRTVTPQMIQETARQYLRPAHRTILTIVPGAGQEKKAPAAASNEEKQP
jgi:zinc protease